MNAMRSNQEIFDIVLVAMRKQAKRSVNVQGICAYRGAQGARCPIGHLIPDEHYRNEFEGKGLFWKYNILTPVGEYCQSQVNSDLIFLNCLQKCHDSYNKYQTKETFMAFYERKMQAVATLFGLTYGE